MTRIYWDVESEPLRHDQVIPPAVVAGVAIDDGPVVLMEPKRAAHVLRREAGRGATCVGFRTAFDVATLGLEPGDFPTPYRDLNVAAVIKGAADGRHEKAAAGLADCVRPLGMTLTGKKSTQTSFRVGAPLTDEQKRYLREDVEATRLLDAALPVQPDEARQTTYAWDVWLMARRGVRLDVPRVKAMVAAAEDRYATLRKPLEATGLVYETGPKKARRLSVKRETVQALLRELGVTAKPRRKAHDDRAESELLSAEDSVLRGTGDRRLIALADFKDAEKQLSLIRALDVGEYARAFWKPIVASGRISASGPNFTQIPKDEAFRGCVIPPEGHVIVEADFSELEFRCWAHICETEIGWSEAAEAYRAGRSPHLVLAAALLGISYEEAVARYKAGDPVVKAARDDSKAGNYGIIGGMGPPKLAETYGLTEERAIQVRNTWRRTWPESRRYFANVKAGAEGEKFRVRLPYSGRERLGFYSESCNFRIQGTGADVTKLALHKATKAGVGVVIKMHDALLAYAPRQDAPEVARIIAASMEEAGLEVAPRLPWKQDVKILERWA